MSIPHALSSDLMKTAFMTALRRHYGQKTAEAVDDIVVEPNPDRKGRSICFSHTMAVVAKISAVGSRLAVFLFVSSREDPVKPLRIATYRFDNDDIPELAARLTAIRVLGTFSAILLFPLEITSRAIELCEDIISLSCMMPDIATAAALLGMDAILNGIAIPEPLDGILTAVAESVSDLSETFVPEWIRNAVAEAFKPILAASGLDRFGIS